MRGFFEQHPRTCYALASAAVVVGCVAAYRGYRNLTKPPQLTDQPLDVWVHNADYDESLACDVLEQSPRPLAKWLARAAFYPTLYWTAAKVTNSIPQLSFFLLSSCCSSCCSSHITSLLSLHFLSL